MGPEWIIGQSWFGKCDALISGTDEDWKGHHHTASTIGTWLRFHNISYCSITGMYFDI